MRPISYPSDILSFIQEKNSTIYTLSNSDREIVNNREKKEKKEKEKEKEKERETERETERERERERMDKSMNTEQ